MAVAYTFSRTDHELYMSDNDAPRRQSFPWLLDRFAFLTIVQSLGAPASALNDGATGMGAFQFLLTIARADGKRAPLKFRFCFSSQ